MKFTYFLILFKYNKYFINDVIKIINVKVQVRFILIWDNFNFF